MGYNRDKEKLPQINMGMYYGEENGFVLQVPRGKHF